MKTVDCFSCDLSLGCSDCEYSIYKDGYATNKHTGIKRTIEAWNHNHPNDLMPQKGRCIHHKNSNRLDDSENNMEKKTTKKHHQDHMNGNQNGKGNKGKKHTEEQNEKNRIGSLGKQNALGSKHPHTEEAKEKQRQARLKYWKEKRKEKKI